MKARILIIADDAAMRATLARWLMTAGYAVELAESARRAREVIGSQSVSLAVMTPQGMGEAGGELARELSERIKHLILVADPTKDAASTEPPIQSSAALAWPFSEQDLLARIRSALAGAPAVTAPEAPQVLRFEGYTLDAGARSCVDASGQEVTLTRAEFSLLLAFVRQPGRVLSRDELTHVVAGRSAEPDDRSVDVLISRLRRKIEPDPKAPRLIVTMPGEGYKLTARPQVVATESPPAPSSTEIVAAASSALPPPSGDAAPARLRSFARIVLPAAVIILVVGAGWGVWSNRVATPDAASVSESRPVSSTTPPNGAVERRAAVFKRMVAAMQDDRFNWRTVERLAIESGVDEAEAHEILAEHPGEVVLGKSRDGKVIARLPDK